MNQENNPPHFRKTIRLLDYDYSQPGAYFITIVTQARICLFGKVENGEMVLNDAGMMVEQVCREVEISPRVSLGPIQVMPNHLHLIVNLGLKDYFDQESSERSIVKTNENLVDYMENPSLATVIGRIKSITTCRYIQGVKNQQWGKFSLRLWQRSYYDHVIRNEEDYEVISDYILSNPMNWNHDEENSRVTGSGD